MKNVLYLGMADDIMSPLMLVPDLENLYVINLLAPAFSPDGTWEGLKNDIKTILTDGSNINGYKKMRDLDMDSIKFIVYYLNQ